MAEFRKLSDVEVVEAVSNAANVLIEENGVIKKAPKTAVGGVGGGETPDMILIINTGGMLSNATTTDMSIDGDASLVINKLINNENPTVWVKTKFIYGGTEFIGLIKTPSVVALKSGFLRVEWVGLDGYTQYYYCVHLNTNNTVDFFGKQIIA